MLRINRSRFIGIVCVTIFLYFLVFTDSGTSSSNFRTNTEAGLARKQDREKDLPLRGRLSDEDLTKKTNDELQGILSSRSKEKLAKDEYGNALGRQYQDPVYDTPTRAGLEKEGTAREDPDRSDPAEIEGRRKLSPDLDEEESDRSSDDTKVAIDKKEKALKVGDETAAGTDPVNDPLQEKLDDYLRSPVVIFSKSYCPHSRKAKHLLLDLYDIKPRPVVVELDQLPDTVDIPSHHSSTEDSEHEEHHKINLGKALQNLLAERTGRRTVPNIIVGGKHSIGGNDDIWALHNSGALVDEIQRYGGRKIISIDLNDSESDGHR